MVKDLSIIIPAFNEAKRLPSTLRSITAYFASSPIPAEVLVVDDGSTDGTADMVKADCGNAVRVVQLDWNYGKFTALRAGVTEAKSSWVLFYDADGATPISMIEKAMDAAKKSNCVIGSRAHAETTIFSPQSWWRVKAGRLGNRLIRGMTGLATKDSQCGFKLVRRDVAHAAMKQMTVERFAGDIEFLYLVQEAGETITEIGIEWNDVPISTVRPKDYVRTLMDLLRIRRNIKQHKYTT